MADDREHISTEKARGGTAPKMTRYILVISLLLIVIIYAIIVSTGVMSANPR